MHTYRFELTLAALLLALLVLSQWHTPGSKLGADEIDGYMSSLELNLPWPAQEKGDLFLPMLSWALAC